MLPTIPLTPPTGTSSPRACPLRRARLGYPERSNPGDTTKAFERRREVDAAAERQHGVREAGRQDDAVHRPEQRPQGQRVRGVGRSREAVPLQRAEQRLRAEPTLRTTACAKGDDLHGAPRGR